MIARPFVGRGGELALLQREFAAVRETGTGRFVLVRGRRRVGKSRLITEFLARSDMPSVYFTATQQQPSGELAAFAAALRRSNLPAARLLESGAQLGTWEAGFRMIAQAGQPCVVVLDELPYLAHSDASFEAQLQAIWDQVLEPAPVLLVVVGSDIAMMEALTSYERPLYGRPTRQLVVRPLRPREVAALLDLEPAAAVDALLVIGGFPLLALSWPGGMSRGEFLEDAVSDPTSALVTSAERTLAAEFPAPETRTVLQAIGAGAVVFSITQQRTGLAQTSLRRTLDALVAARVVELAYPLSAHPSRRLARYLVGDPYLRFWLRFLGPGLPDIERGRADLVLLRIQRDWSTYRGLAVKPLVRDALARRLPERRLPGTERIGAWWDRTGRDEVDLVGTGTDPRSGVTLVGSIKWRQRRRFSADDLAELKHHAGVVPGAGAATRLVVASRTGSDVEGVDLVLGPPDLLT